MKNGGKNKSVAFIILFSVFNLLVIFNVYSFLYNIGYLLFKKNFLDVSFEVLWADCV